MSGSVGPIRVDAAPAPRIEAVLAGGPAGGVDADSLSAAQATGHSKHGGHVRLGPGNDATSASQLAYSWVVMQAGAARPPTGSGVSASVAWRSPARAYRARGLMPQLGACADMCSSVSHWILATLTDVVGAAAPELCSSVSHWIRACAADMEAAALGMMWGRPGGAVESHRIRACAADVVGAAMIWAWPGAAVATHWMWAWPGRQSPEPPRRGRRSRRRRGPRRAQRPRRLRPGSAGGSADSIPSAVRWSVLRSSRGSPLRWLISRRRSTLEA